MSFKDNQSSSLLIVPIAIYTRETWSLKEVDKTECIWKLLPQDYRWNFLHELNQSGWYVWLWIPNKIIDIIKKRLKWFSYVVYKENANYDNHSDKNNFTKSRPRGWLSERWNDLIREDTKLPLLTMKRLANGWMKWKYYVVKYHKLWHASLPYKPEKKISLKVGVNLNGKAKIQNLALVDYSVVKVWISALLYKLTPSFVKIFFPDL